MNWHMHSHRCRWRIKKLKLINFIGIKCRTLATSIRWTKRWKAWLEKRLSSIHLQVETTLGYIRTSDIITMYIEIAMPFQ